MIIKITIITLYLCTKKLQIIRIVHTIVDPFSINIFNHYEVNITKHEWPHKTTSISFNSSSLFPISLF